MQLEHETATEENFNEMAYALANIDAALAIMNGKYVDAWAHFMAVGKKEGRRQLVAGMNQRALDKRYLADDVPLAQAASHANRGALLNQLCKPGMRIMEIGSRCVTAGESHLRRTAEAAGADYLGIDYYEGPNVDIACDAHRLSEHVSGDFDLIVSFSVFEHLAMPWLVAEEIRKLLRLGGHVLIETHFSWKSHERPWHFFQFSDMALRSLFSPAMGFQCIDAGVSNPMVGRFSALADDYLRYRPVPKIYCHSSYLGQKLRDVPSFDWRTASIEDVVGSTQYPNKPET
jgi:SAM-dependent methyltransferase